MYPRAITMETPISFCHLPCSEVRLYTEKQKQQKKDFDTLQYIFWMSACAPAKCKVDRFAYVSLPTLLLIGR